MAGSISLKAVTVAGISVLAAAVAQPLEDPMQRRPAHHTERGFRNPDGGPDHSDAPLSVTLPFFARRVAASIAGRADADSAPPRLANDGTFVRENALGSVPTVTWIGHSTLLVQMGHVTFLTDPTWSRTASPVAVGPRRFVDPGVAFEDLPKIDFALVSHNHYDHMDLATLERLAEKGTQIFVPLGNAAILEGIAGVTELDWWEEQRFDGVSIHCVPARHWSRRGVADVNRSLWSGWVVVADDRRFYFAGDTGTFAGFAEIGRRLGPFDLAAMPIGAYEPRAMMAPSHINPEEAIGALAGLAAKRSVAIHYGTFDLSDEPIDDPPRRFLAASAAAGRGPDRDWVLAVGETRVW